MFSQSNSNRLNEIASIIFWIGIILEFVVSFSGYAYGGYHEPLIIVAGMGCFSLKILLSIDYKNITRFIKKEAVWYVLILGYGCLCYLTQGSALVLRIGLIILAGRDQKAKDVIRVFFWGTIGVMIVTALLSAVGMHNELSITDLFRHVPETRYCFGFYHPNGFALFLVRVIIMGIYLYGDTLKWWGLIVAGAIAGPLLVLVNSKMAYACVAVLLIMAIVLRIAKKDDKDSSLVIKSIFTLGLIIMIVELLAIVVYCANYEYVAGVLAGEDNIWYYINAATSGRLFNAARVWNEGLPAMLGIKNLADGTEIGFFNVMYGQGIVFAVIYLVVQFYLYIRSYKKHEYYSMLLVLGFAIYSLSEAFIPYVNKNAVWMLLIGMFA